MKGPQFIFASIFTSLLLATGIVRSAHAHIVAVPDSAPANATLSLSIDVPHGCGVSPTTRIRVQIPSTVELISAMNKPGWKLIVESADAKSGSNTEGNKSELIWTGGPLPSDKEDKFQMLVKLPDRPGEKLYFKTIQDCQEGISRWIEIPKYGEDVSDYKRPAPSVTLTVPK